MAKYDKTNVEKQEEKKDYGSMSKAEKERFKKQIVEEKKRKGEDLPWWFDDGSEEKVAVKKEEPKAVEPALAPILEPQPVIEEPVVEKAEEKEEVIEEKKPAKKAPAKKKTAPAKKVEKKSSSKKAVKNPAKKATVETPAQVVTVVAPVQAQAAAGYGRYCTYCGRLIPWDSNFCPACGQKLEPAVKPEDENKGVKFAEEDRKTFNEQLAALKKKDRALYDNLIAYALSKEDARISEAKYAVTVIVGRYKLIQLLFQRGKLVSKFMTASSDFKKYTAQEKSVKIKERPTVVEIDSEESVAAAKNLVDITYNNIQEARGKTVD